MSLKKYREKRNFNRTPEPQGGRAEREGLRFVIQKHDASRLHYDFRLEMKGTLKSWAVPKGPSLNPADKRLAMMVEDHPLDYRNFEGIIPEGYGAGTVIIWDEGVYEPLEFPGTKAEQEKELLRQLKSGKLKVLLKGKKLKGYYTLVKSGGRGENGWLLIKGNDKYAQEEDILVKDKSVRSRKTIEQMEGKKGQKTSVEPRKTTSLKLSRTSKLKGKRKAFPATIKPMLATLADKAFDNEEWIFEIKWDGYRSLAFVNGAQTKIKSRNDKDFTEKYYPVTKALSELATKAVTDGELVVISEDGKPDFGALQNWRSEADGELLYYAFDVLWYDGKDLTTQPLTERFEILKQIIPENDIIRISSQYKVTGTEFFAAVSEMGLEGMMAKKADSLYYPGIRSRDWLKIKANKRQEVVIGGYTVNEGTGKLFSSLLVGVYQQGELIYFGKVGTGFNQKLQKELIQKFKPLIRKTSPFSTEPELEKPSRFRRTPPKTEVTWLSPKLVCEVSFTEITNDGVMRHPSFKGMRIDKAADSVVLEKETQINKLLHPEPQKKQKIIKPTLNKSRLNKSRKTLLNPKEETQVKTINGHKLKFSNLSKLYWPDEKISKREMLNYYYQIAPYILPYLKDRPMSLNRHPNGIKGHSFYQKDITGKSPDWVEKFLYHSSDDDRDKHFLVGKDEATLLYMASLGCIELNPWSSRITSPDNPDFCIIDLDPDKNTFDQVVEAALVTKEVLDSMGVPSYPKTSGSTGMHIYVPLGAKYSYEQSKEFARVVATMVHRLIPEFTSIERIVANRKGKMYIDFLQNRPQATIATVYSLRPKPGAPVSMPLPWVQVKKGLKITDFTIRNVPDILKEQGDIFAPVLGEGIDLNLIIENFGK